LANYAMIQKNIFMNIYKFGIQSYYAIILLDLSLRPQLEKRLDASLGYHEIPTFLIISPEGEELAKSSLNPSFGKYHR